MGSFCKKWGITLDRKFAKSAALMVVAMFIMTLGVAVSAKAGLGTSSISSVPYVLSLGLPLSYGTFTFILNGFFIVLQWYLAGKKLSLMLILEIPVLLIFSIFSDLTLPLVDFLSPGSYFEQWILVMISCVMLAFGISVEMRAGFAMMPGEGMVFALSRRFRREFGRFKMIFDITLVISAALISLAMFAGFFGVREGTVFAALTIGLMVKGFMKLMKSNGTTDLKMVGENSTE